MPDFLLNKARDIYRVLVKENDPLIAMYDELPSNAEIVRIAVTAGHRAIVVPRLSQEARANVDYTVRRPTTKKA